MPAQVNYLLQDGGKSCDMLIYFNRPNCLRHMKYAELFKKYTANTTLPVLYTNNPALYLNNIEGYFELNIIGLQKRMFLCKRQKHEQTIVRMEMVCVTAGEIWFLRLLLLHRSSISFQDTRMINNTLYPTFQAAAVAANLVTDLTIARECFDQSVGLSTPQALRGLFATLTINGYPTLCIYNDERYKHLLLQDWLEFQEEPLNIAQANNQYLVELQRCLQKEDKNLEMYGFPLPLHKDTELERERLLYTNRNTTSFVRTVRYALPKQYRPTCCI